VPPPAPAAEPRPKPGVLAVIARRWSAALARLRNLGRPRDRRDPLGAQGEAQAWTYLKARGYRLLGRNLRVPMGEADLLCRDPDGRTIVLVEVKSRRVRAGSRPFARPEASVHAHKRRKLVSIARHLARANGWPTIRIDVVAIEFVENADPVIRHWSNAVGFSTRARR